MPKSVRLSVKAIILLDGELLTMHYRDRESDFYALPGGGVLNGENLAAALQRECLEEANARISVGDVVFVREYIEDHHEFAGNKPGFHQVEIMFSCDILNPDEVNVGEEMDERQIGFAWLPIDHLEEYCLYPKVLIATIQEYYSKRPCPIYLGDVD